MAERTIAIVQARTGSSRLPGKVLKDVAGRPLIGRVLERVRDCRSIDAVVLATSAHRDDAVLRGVASAQDAFFFQGSENDVLDRYYRAAAEFNAGTIVRVTGDCPLIDPDIVDRVVGMFRSSDCDYASNTQPPTYPDGLDVEVLSMAALSKAWTEAAAVSEREHVTPYIWKHPDRFRHSLLRNDEDLSGLRWVVDEPEDLRFVRIVFEELGDSAFRMNDVLRLLERRPELAALNGRFTRNEGYRKSIESERGRP